MKNKTIYCYLDDLWHGQLYLGNLYVQNERGREIYSFEWSKEYLQCGENKIFFDPQIYEDMYGRQYAGDHLFGMFSDSCPDRWGRLLMKRRESLQAKDEGRRPNTLLERIYRWALRMKAMHWIFHWHWKRRSFISCKRKLQEKEFI